MAKYTEIDIQIPYDKDSVAEAICEAIQDFKNKVVEHGIVKEGESFDCNITDLDDYGTQVEVKLNSGRAENAEWQTYAIIKILQSEEILPLSFEADKNLNPFISLEQEDFKEFNVNKALGI